MKIADFGEFDGPVMVAGGVASNLHALEAFVEMVGERPVILTGDIVAYGAHPAECAARVRDLDWPVVAGNVERQLAASAPDCGCGFAPGTTCDRLSAAWYAHARAAMTDELSAWMADLPDLAMVTIDGLRFAVIHGGATEIARFVWPSDAEAVFAEEAQAIRAALGEVDGVLAGHAGLAFARDAGGLRWINAGSLGLPPHDGRPFTRFAEVKDGEAIFHRLHYDHDAARSAMESASLTQGYHETLTTGIWPSEDVLPLSLRR